MNETTNPTQIKGYHFTGDALRDGRPIPAAGEWLEHTGPVEPCESGLHASECPFDALNYAPGNLLHRVVLEGDLKSHADNGRVDKWVGRRRNITASVNAEDLMRDFAHWCALRVIHLWEAPEIVKRYLETGDESLWAAARAAAWAAARDAAWAAAGDAARAAARDAAWAAARAAAWAAARAAAWAAAGDAARAAAWAAAGDAARAAQRDKFRELVNAKFDEGKGNA